MEMNFGNCCLKKYFQPSTSNDFHTYLTTNP